MGVCRSIERTGWVGPLRPARGATGSPVRVPNATSQRARARSELTDAPGQRPDLLEATLEVSCNASMAMIAKDDS